MNSKPLPPIINAAVMREHASEGETHAIRIILLNSVGATLYTLRGQGRRKGKYILEKSGASGRHQLDVPVSVWNRDLPKGRYHDNPSIAHDLLSRPNPLAPFALQIVPWNSVETSEVESLGDAPAESPTEISPSLVNLIETLVLRLAEAKDIKRCDSLLTPYLHTAIQRESAEPSMKIFEACNRTEILEFINKMWPPYDPDAPSNDAPPEHIPDAATKEPTTPPQTTGSKAETPAARRMREKRARDRAKREAAKLQTA